MRSNRFPLNYKLPTDSGLPQLAEYPHVLSQADSSGFYTQALDKIVLHRKLENTVYMKDAYFTTKRVFCKLRHTTIGWEFIIEWKDGSISWISLKVFK